MATSAGEALHHRLREGDLSAAVPFAYQVFEQGYKGSAADEKAAGTKKAVKAMVRGDAISYLEQAAEAGSLDAMLELTGFWFHGVREPGAFGSTLVIPAYRKCRPWLEQIMAHPDSDSEERAQAAFRLAQSWKLLGDGEADGEGKSVSEPLWQQAIELDPDSETAALARSALGEWLLYHTERTAEAEPLLRASAEQVASAAFALADGLRRGVWGEPDTEQAEQWLATGNRVLSSKRTRG